MQGHAGGDPHTKEVDVAGRFRGNELNPVSKHRRRDRQNQGSDGATKHVTSSAVSNVHCTRAAGPGTGLGQT